MKRTPLQDTLSITKALSDRQRVRILMLLTGGERCVCQIVEVVKLAASTISKHLSILTAAGLLECRKDGRWAYYRLADATPALAWLQKSLHQDPAIRADQAILHKIIKQTPESLCRQQRPS